MPTCRNQNIVSRITPQFIVLIALLLAGTAQADEQPKWTGTGSVRVIVEVPPIDLKERTSDEMVAACEIDFARILAERGLTGWVNLSTLQVHRLDPASGDAQPFPAFASARTPYDRPCRFDDDSLPEEYPSRIVRASLVKEGRAPTVIQRRKGRLFNREVDPAAGRIVWVHTQDGQTASRYAIYFDVQDRREGQVSPAPWIGDADVLRSEKGQSLGGFSHFSATTGDFNGDGLFDLLAGTEKGDLMWFPNRGTPGEPKFIGCHILRDEQGPIDTGWYGSPFLFDWDNDGVSDLLVGTSGNVILWWKNVGSKTEPKLEYCGFVQSDGKRLEVPEGPVPEDAGKKTFVRDYYNQPWVGDWTGDGLPDILTGGYVTGQIFLFRGVGRDEQGVPKLEYAGPVEADGKPIDTTWAAAPSAGDFDGDGRLELVTGSWWWSGIPHEPEPGQIDYLMYYRNDGSATELKLARAPLPREGDFPRGVIARPTSVDWNADGLIDLLVSESSGNVYVFLNIGSAKEPKWRTSQEPLTIPWGFVEGFDATAPSANVVGDEKLEFLTGATVFTVEGSAHSPRSSPLGRATAAGKPIEHPGPGYGDPYYFTILHDWDGDGKPDLLWGTQQGNIYLHRAQGGDKPLDFAEGELIKLTNGEPLKVGPPVVDSIDKATDFTILQGSRIIFTAADFDGDKIDDLIVEETFGNIWLFRNTRKGGVDTLDPPVQLAKLSGRTACLVSLDWNNDGKPDLLTQGTAAAPGLLFLNETADGKPALGKPSRPFDLPFMFWGSQFGVSDWNRDGDRDVMVNSEFFAFYVEQSFLAHGYRESRIVNIAQRDPAMDRRSN